MLLLRTTDPQSYAALSISLETRITNQWAIPQLAIHSSGALGWTRKFHNKV